MESSAFRMMYNEICLLPLTTNHIKILFSKGILTCFPSVFPRPARQVFTNSLPFSRRVFFSLTFFFHPPFLLFLTLVSVIQSLDSFLSFFVFSFHLLLSSSSFPFGHNFCQGVGDFRKWVRNNTREDERKELLGLDFSMPKDFVMWLLHCFTRTKLCLVGKRNLYQPSLSFNVYAYVSSVVLSFFSCL